MLKKQVSPKIVAIVFAVIVVVFAIAVYVSAQWTEPTEAPPGSNVPAPLNVSSIGQSKIGGLALNTGIDGIPSVDGAANGLLIYDGNVGIGTVTPSEKLDVVGNIRVDSASDVCIDGGNCLSNNVSSWRIKLQCGPSGVTQPSQFVNPQVQYQQPEGQIFHSSYVGLGRDSMGCYPAFAPSLFEIKVNSIGTQTKRLYWRTSNSSLFIYLNGNLVYQRNNVYENGFYDLDLINGENLVQIVYSNNNSIYYTITLFANMVNNINTFFIPF